MNFDLDFTGKNVLVVGGSSGIGNATAQAYRTNGANVAVWGTRPSADDYAGQDGSDLTGLHYAQVDVGDFDSIAAAELPFNTLDVLVLSQGLVLYKRQEFDVAGFQKVLDVNLTSLMACCNKFLDKLLESRGNVVVVSSTAAFHATMGTPAYSASKAGTMGLIRSLAQLHARKGVRFNAVAPGMIPTKMTKVTTEDEDRAKQVLAHIPMARFGESAEIAGTILFLSSPLAGYITGQTIAAEGGLLL